MKNSRNEAEIEKLFITTCEKILMALLEGELQNNVLAKRVGITQQHLSRLLPKLQRNDFIVSRFLNVRRINSLTTKGKILAELSLKKRNMLMEANIINNRVGKYKESTPTLEKDLEDLNV